MADLIQTTQTGAQPAKSASKSKKPQVAKRSEAHAAIENELVKALLEQLPYFQLSPEESSRAVIFAKYIDSLAKINSYRDELIALAFSLGRATISYDAPPHYAVRVDSEKKVVDQYRIHLDAPVNNAGADLGALPTEEIREYLTPALTDACRKLIEQFMDGLTALVGRQLIGIADWPSEDTVKYWYCRHRVTAQAAVTTRTSKLVSSQTDIFNALRRQTDTVEHRDAKYVPTTLTRECHRHDAIEAHRCSIEEATVVIPENVKALIAAIPVWMRPLIRIADGYLIRKRTEDRKTISTSVITQVTVHEEVTSAYVHGTDPALLLGNLVLIGWGPEEIEQELKAEGERQVVAACVSGAAYWGASAFFIQVLIILLSNKILIQPGGVLLVMLAFASSVFCFARCIGYGFRAKSFKPDELELQVAVAGPVLLFAGLQTIIIPGSFLWPVLGFTLLCLGGYLSFKSPFYRSL